VTARLHRGRNHCRYTKAARAKHARRFAEFQWMQWLEQAADRRQGLVVASKDGKGLN
jgi:hypothetical protein